MESGNKITTLQQQQNTAMQPFALVKAHPRPKMSLLGVGSCYCRSTSSQLSNWFVKYFIFSSPASRKQKEEKRNPGQQELSFPPGPILDMCWFLKFGKLDASVGRSGNGCTLQVPPDPRSPGVAIAFEEDDSWAGAAAAAVVTIV